MAATVDKNSRAVISAKTGKSRSWLLVAVVALLALAGAGAGWYFAERRAAVAAEAAAAAAKPALPAPALYFALEPPFVVNLNGPMDGPRYLQVEVQLMTRDAAVHRSMELHAPAIRSVLLMLFSQQAAESIADHAGKQKLKTQALVEVKKLLQAETGNSAVEDLLFTSFVTQ